MLSSMSLGRLVTILGGQPEIFPVNFVTQHRAVLVRTAQGVKLFSAVMNDRMAFEADGHTVAEGCSAITGRAICCRRPRILEAQEARLLPWTAMLKPLHACDGVVQQR